MKELRRRAMSFEEAEREFARLGVDAAEFEELVAEYKQIATSLVVNAEISVLAMAKKKAQAAVEDGESIEAVTEWAKTAGGLLVMTVAVLMYRMAAISAAARGRWQRMKTGNAEYLMYDAVDDERTRPTHRAMDGRVWRKSEFPQEWVPPNGYNCRCHLRELSKRSLKKSGGRLQSGPPAESPDEGFQTNQAENLRGTLEKALADARMKLAG
jgi:SPP1 gp7 family putative phage head morphogenesis protein